jgi:hypothetical protein
MVWTGLRREPFTRRNRLLCGVVRAVGHTAKREIERNKSRTLEVNAGKLLAV